MHVNAPLTLRLRLQIAAVKARRAIWKPVHTAPFWLGFFLRNSLLRKQHSVLPLHKGSTFLYSLAETWKIDVNESYDHLKLPLTGLDYWQHDYCIVSISWLQFSRVLDRAFS